MGYKTNSAAHAIGQTHHESVGFMPRKKCPACKKPRHGSSEKCSRELQRMSQRGEI